MGRPDCHIGKADTAGSNERRVRPVATPGYWRRHVHNESARNTGSPEAWSGMTTRLPRGTGRVGTRSEERLAKTLNVDIKRIKTKRTLLDGVCPEVAEMLKDQSVDTAVFTL